MQASQYRKNCNMKDIELYLIIFIKKTIKMILYSIYCITLFIYLNIK